MAIDFVRGIKAGIVSGIIGGVINGILVGALISVLFASFVGAAAGAAGAAAGALLAGAAITGAVIGGIIGGIIGGLIFGLIYAAIYDHLPGGSSVVKGIVIALVAWVVLGLLPSLSSPFGVTLALVGIVGNIIFGVLLGKLWDKFGGAPAAPAKA